LGLNCYFKPGLSSFERYLDVKKIYFSSTSIRMIRMLGAYGIGGNINRNLRNYLISKYEDPLWET